MESEPDKDDQVAASIASAIVSAYLDCDDEEREWSEDEIRTLRHQFWTGALELLAQANEAIDRQWSYRPAAREVEIRIAPAKTTETAPVVQMRINGSVSWLDMVGSDGTLDDALERARLYLKEHYR